MPLVQHWGMIWGRVRILRQHLRAENETWIWWELSNSWRGEERNSSVCWRRKYFSIFSGSVGCRAENSLCPLLFIPGCHFQCQATFKWNHLHSSLCYFYKIHKRHSGFRHNILQVSLSQPEREAPQVKHKRLGCSLLFKQTFFSIPGFNERAFNEFTCLVICSIS